MKKIGITIVGDSIIYNKYRGKNFDWSKNLKKDLLKKTNDNFLIKKKTVHGINSRGILNLLPDFFFKLKTKYKKFLIVQIGINDSWHYKSMNGHPCVPKNIFMSNLKEINKLGKIYKFENIIFLNYHTLKKNRIESNGKSINQNLKVYNNIIMNFCRKKELYFININSLIKKKRNICLPLPDGVHLNKKGIAIYSDIVSNFIIKKINEKNL